ncbi:GL23922 [Drosophila persimilis]|uniref:GPI ethanolamine phosphate transferase 1 n=1 Tax=Drosophila persimilis TaxID=7234 RepID=B4G2K3_DROPE|nr:GPI ethanolamine phosphate transferase 1 [Drosophila persimilis]EDW24048.1 GL23922 [Drosophila persimilis]
MWKLKVLVVHILLLGCMMNIYFQSTIVQNLEPQKTLPELGLKPPADRLVVFIADGLRAESFFSDNCSGVPHIRQLLEQQGVVGISSGIAPTMSRPGHIAIFSGFNEDPQAAITNFQWNLTPFDSIFNRSRLAIGWVHQTVAEYFTRFSKEPPMFETYRGADFSGRFMTDTWVYEKARDYLNNDENIRQLQNATQVVFLVYLFDLDKAGHVFTPLKPEFRKKLYATQKQIRKTYDLFESAFNDSRTAYLMTSDHGMSDTGYHGGGTDPEIEMPFFLWGAGIKRQGPPTEQNFTANDHGLQLPLQELNQIQLAPLISALIGLPPPINNRAPLPLGFLNVSEEYERQSLLLNVLQLLAQAKSVTLRFERSFFHKWLPKYEKLDTARIASLPTEIEHLIATGYVKKAMQLLLQMSWWARQCLDYYQDYYHTPLLVAIGASFLGWLFCLVVWLMREFSDQEPQPKMGLQTWATALMLLLGSVLECLLFLQRVPCLTSFYLLLPIGIWTMALAERPLHGISIPYPLIHLAWTVIPAGLVVATSFMNRHVGLMYAGVAVAYNRHGFRRPTLKFFIWLGTVLLPSGFMIVKQNYSFELMPSEYVLGFSMCLAVLLPWILGHKHQMRVWLINSFILLIGIYGIYLSENNLEVPLYLQVAFWAFLGYAFLSVPYSNADTPESRLHLISFNLIAVHALLSLSTGSLFNQMMITEFLLSHEIHSEINQAKNNAILETDEPESDSNNENASETTQKNEENPSTPLEHLKLSYHYAAFILFYFYLSFFGSGHWLFSFAFKPTTSRLLISNYSPFIMTALIILKILIPSIIVISGVYTFSAYARKKSRAVFICMFLISDVMCFYFCFYVQNQGSWHDMRRSMDHVVLTNIIVILLLGCSWLIKSFLIAIKRIAIKPPIIMQVVMEGSPVAGPTYPQFDENILN